MKYDVIIVGAGIAGTYLASMLSRKGIKILILEREPNERTSFCGELTGIDTVKRLGISPKSDMVAKWYKNVKLHYLDNGFEISVPDKSIKICLLETQKAKSHFLKKALENGAEARFNTAVKTVIKETDKVIGVKAGNEIIKSEVVVGADGSNSIIAKTAGFDLSKYKAMPSFRYKYKNAKGLNEDDALFIVGREIGLGYLWIYPRANKKVNVGIGAINNPKMTPFFNKYVKNMKELKGAKIYSKDGDTVPYSGLLPQIAKKGIALVGDSAGQVNSLLGGGVASSTRAAEILAPYIAETIEKNDPSILLGYDKAYKNSKEGKRIIKTTILLKTIINASKKEDIFDIFEEIQATVSDKLLKKLSLGHFILVDALFYCLSHPFLFYKVMSFYFKYK